MGGSSADSILQFLLGERMRLDEALSKDEAKAMRSP
jgi:hypothetical protein